MELGTVEPEVEAESEVGAKVGAEEFAEVGALGDTDSEIALKYSRVAKSMVKCRKGVMHAQSFDCSFG
jgi:hypothetical protein